LSYPELYSDERVVLQAQNVKVKSVLFEVVLTTRRLVLIDTKKNSIPPQEINLATLKDVESGENAIRDPTLTISIITISGNTRQMVLTFSKTSGGERRRECDEWVRALRQNITSTVYHPVTQGPAPKEAEQIHAAQPPEVRSPEHVQAAQPPDIQPPEPAPHRIETSNTPPPKRRIEIARPMKKIVEAAPTMPVPVETSSLPSGSFCNRCGNRVPPDSVFCNRCGTPVVRDTDSGDIPMVEFAAPAAPAEPVVPQVQVTPSPNFPTITDKKDRPIENVIHSIEPLIEGSVPRTAPAPLVPAKQVHHAPVVESAEPASPITEAVATTEETPDATAVPPPGDVQWPVLPQSGITNPTAPPAVPVTPPLSRPIPPATLPPRKIPVKLIGVIAFVILVVIAGVFFFMQNQNGTPLVTPTPDVTITATPISSTTVPTIVTTVKPTITPQEVATSSALIPSNGVYVKVTYSGKYSGSVGTPGRLREITESGGPFYQISTSDGPVVVSIRKSEGSSTKMGVDVYKDGTLMKHAETAAPKGLIEFEAIFTPVAAVTTAAVVTTAE
jgi:hypothetical protein